MEKLAVIGAGSWGTTAAWLASANTEVSIWARSPEVSEEINRTRINSKYLGGRELPASLRATSVMAEAVEGAGLVAVAVPSHGFRSVFGQLGHLAVPVVSLTKGIEQGTLLRMTEVVAEVAPHLDRDQVGVLTGPNLASEIAAGQPTAAVVGMTDGATARRVQSVFMGPMFRVYTNDDVIGCELGGSLKNVMAIAAGMSDGLGFGDNTKATLITRALTELTRLGIRLGGRPGTFAGLAGMGDLIATCVSHRSRNHRVGFGLARGKSLDEITAELNEVAEGVRTTRAVLDLAARYEVEMPIASHVGKVLYEGLDPGEAMLALMTREAKSEAT